MDNVFWVLTFAGLVTGFSKFSVGGMGLLILPIIMMVVPGPEALALIVPMYIVTDIMAVLTYRQKIAWGVLARLLPLSLLGMLIGSWWLSGVDASAFSIMLGVLIIGVIVLGFWLDHRPASFMSHPVSAYITGFFAGFVSLIANAAGPLFSLFLVEQKLDKPAYVSTRAWLFLILNTCKVPAFIALGYFHQDTLRMSLYCLPGLAVGALIGYWLYNRLSLTQFKWLIRLMAALAAIKLILF